MIREICDFRLLLGKGKCEGTPNLPSQVLLYCSSMALSTQSSVQPSLGKQVAGA